MSCGVVLRGELPKKSFIIDDTHGVRSRRIRVNKGSVIFTKRREKREGNQYRYANKIFISALGLQEEGESNGCKKTGYKDQSE